MSTIWKQIKNIFIVLLGNSLYSLGIAMFIVPNGIITGGTTGLGLSFQHFFHIKLATFALIFNVIMFILGAIVLGKKFALTTLISTFYFPVILGFYQSIPGIDTVTHDRMLATVCGAILIGLGIGFVIRVGASTGGMDIPPLILNKKFGIPVSVMLYVFDVLILLTQAIFAKDKEQIIYGILLVLIYTVILDKILLMGTNQTQVKIVTKKYEEINNMIVTELDRGSTLLHAETGYLRNEQPVILTVISNRELIRLKQAVMAIDPDAFMIIGHVNEVRGQGFTSQKKYRSKEELRKEC